MHEGEARISLTLMYHQQAELEQLMKTTQQGKEEDANDLVVKRQFHSWCAK